MIGRLLLPAQGSRRLCPPGFESVGFVVFFVKKFFEFVLLV